MNIYLIEREGKIGYDENIGFVVAAENEQQAREFVSKERGDEPPSIWLDGTSKCVLVGTTASYQKPTIILNSFNAG